MRGPARSPSPAGKGARFGIYLAPEKRLALRQAALEEGISATQLLERLLDAYLAGRVPAKGRGR